MKTLLTELRARLRSQITYVEDASIHILLDEDLLPHTTQLPALGLKDMDVGFAQAGMQTVRQMRTVSVKIIAYQSIPRGDTPEAPIMGSGSLKGVLDMIEDIHTAIRAWKPAGTDYVKPVAVREEPSVPMGQEVESPEGVTIRLWAQRKAVVFSWDKVIEAF